MPASAFSLASDNTYLDLDYSGYSMHFKKVVSDIPGLVDFAAGLVPDGQVMFFGEI